MQRTAQGTVQAGTVQAKKNHAETVQKETPPADTPTEGAESFKREGGKMSLPEPYYQDSHVTIYNADCKEILPLLDPVDLVLTDPPYGDILTKKNGHGKLKESAIRYGGGAWDIRPPQGNLHSLLSHGKKTMIWGGNYFSSELPDSRCWLVWDKCNGESSFADAELCWTNFDCAVRVKKHSVQSIQGRSHPTQKPVEIMSWCISLCPNEPQTILDPFMGSGTTLRAAKDLNRKAIGIELEEKYCAIAVERLRQEVLAL